MDPQPVATIAARRFFAPVTMSSMTRQIADADNGGVESIGRNSMHTDANRAVGEEVATLTRFYL